MNFAALFPGRSAMPPDPFAREVTDDNSRHGHIDDGNTAWPERIAEARRSWPQARPEDFERTGRRGYIDRGTGIEFRSVPGAPLLSVATESTRGISAFLVEGHRLVFLRPASYPEELVGPEGRVIGMQVTASNPGPSGSRVI